MVIKVTTLVGSRAIVEPIDIPRATEVAYYLNLLGTVGRSGGAPGMDSLWDDLTDRCQKILPQTVFNSLTPNNTWEIVALEQCPLDIRYRAEAIARAHHPWGDALTGFPLRAHTRNVFQVLGLDLDSPSDITIYAAPETKWGKVSGGTSTAVEISRSNKIPTFNIRNDTDFRDLITLLKSAVEV